MKEEEDEWELKRRGILLVFFVSPIRDVFERNTAQQG